MRFVLADCRKIPRFAVELSKLGEEIAAAVRGFESATGFPVKEAKWEASGHEPLHAFVTDIDTLKVEPDGERGDGLVIRLQITTHP
jgi:hypothetical protein